MRMLLDGCGARHVKLNPEKKRMRLKEVPYIGHLLSTDGVKVVPGRVSDATAERYKMGAAVSGHG